MAPYSVLMSVYAKEQPKYLSEAIDSMLAQTIAPDEVVIVCDGPLTGELNSVLDKYATSYKETFKVVRLAKNGGLGNALRIGIKECSNDFIARMDSDDISLPDRIQKQMDAFERDASLGMVGSNVEEFYDSPEHPVAKVILPETHDEIVRFSRKRCAFRHPSLLYKKEEVLKAGNYSSEYLRFEDTDLFSRMLAAGCRCHNVQDFCVKMRISKDFYERRGGVEYIHSMIRVKYALVQRGTSSPIDFLISAFGQALICALPNSLRRSFYMRFLRENI